LTSFIAFLGTGKGTWGHVSRLMNENWDSIFLVGNNFARKFTHEKKFEFIEIDEKSSAEEIKKRIVNGIKDKIRDTEVALNIVSGEGREHSALIAAIMEAGYGFRLVLLTKDGMKTL